MPDRENGKAALQRGEWHVADSLFQIALSFRPEPDLQAATSALKLIEYLPHYFLGQAYFFAGRSFLVRPRMSFVAKRFSLIPIRIGVHTNPGHRIYATGNNPDLKRLFPKAKDRVHFSFGSGFLLNSYLKFDASITISADSFVFIGSTLIALPL